MSFAPFTKSSLVLLEGDSLSDPALQYQAMNGIRNYTYSHFNAGVSGSFTPPKFRNQSTNGATIGTISARIVAELAVNPYTHLVVFAGINDAQSGVALGTSQTNCSTILTAAAALSILWISPLCWGELWPSGQNAASVDTAIDGGVPGVYGALDGALKTLVVAAGGVYVDVRQLVYAVQEPLLNSATPGIKTGPLTRPDATGAHVNQSGSSFITKAVTPSLTFA